MEGLSKIFDSFFFDNFRVLLQFWLQVCDQFLNFLNFRSFRKVLRKRPMIVQGYFNVFESYFDISEEDVSIMAHLHF